jgi:hypothetical protein
MVKFADDSPEYRIVIGFLNTLIQVVRPDPTALLKPQQFRSGKERASVTPSQTGRSKRARFLNAMASASTVGLSCTYSGCNPLLCPAHTSNSIRASNANPTGVQQAA